MWCFQLFTLKNDPNGVIMRRDLDLRSVGDFVMQRYAWKLMSELPSSKILITHLLSFFLYSPPAFFFFFWQFFSFSKRIAENHFVPSQSTFQNVLAGPLMKMLRSIIPRTDPMEDPANDWFHRSKKLIFSFAHYISDVFLSFFERRSCYDKKAVQGFKHCLRTAKIQIII